MIYYNLINMNVYIIMTKRKHKFKSLKTDQISKNKELLKIKTRIKLTVQFKTSLNFVNVIESKAAFDVVVRKSPVV